MNKRERLLAEKEERKARKLLDSDYLLGVYDITRMGGLRFKLSPDSNFVSDDKSFSVPSWATLRTLEEASRNLEKEELVTEKWLAQLLRPGSSLGGARPKATVADADGNFWIAKFPSKHDENDTGAWEMVAHDLAQKSGLNVPEARLERFSNLGSTFLLVKRFDRNGKRRVHFASAMTLLGKMDGASAADGTSYLDIAGFIKANGASPQKDLNELWKRIVFNMAISNTDDHLRNHAFLFTSNGWRLSPLYDVNPVSYGDELSLNVDDGDNRISIDLALRTAPRFGISEKKARYLADEILAVVRENWTRFAEKYCISRANIAAMKPAFLS